MMKKRIPPPAERPDLYDAYDGVARPKNWRNPVGLSARLQKLMAGAATGNASRGVVPRSSIAKVKVVLPKGDAPGEAVLKTKFKRTRTKPAPVKTGRPVAGKVAKGSA